MFEVMFLLERERERERKGLGKLLQKMCSGWRVVTVLEKVSTVQPVNFEDKYFVIWQLSLRIG